MMITTTKGDMDESLLEKKTGVVDNDNEYTTWVEYRLPGTEEIIHRSAHVTFKRNVASHTELGGFGG